MKRITLVTANIFILALLFVSGGDAFADSVCTNAGGICVPSGQDACIGGTIISGCSYPNVCCDAPDCSGDLGGTCVAGSGEQACQDAGGYTTADTSCFQNSPSTTPLCCIESSNLINCMVDASTTGECKPAGQCTKNKTTSGECIRGTICCYEKPPSDPDPDPGGGPGGGSGSGLVPCATEANPEMCTLCHLIIGAQNIINYGLFILTFVAVTCLVIAGIIYIVSSGSEKITTMAKDFIRNILFGSAIILLGWVIINTTIVYLATKGDLGLGIEDKWKVTCNTTSSAGTTDVGGELGSSGGSGGGPGGSGPSGPGPGSGKCEPVNSGPCSEENLKGTCWDQFASKNPDIYKQASSICNAESGGGAGAASGTDKCRDGNSFSYGLFQINLTVHDIGGYNCAYNHSDSPFTAKNYSCTVKDTAQYNKCVNAAKTASTNIEKACEIHKSRGWDQWGANTGDDGCGF